jgi:inorganic triphosphatase YgiF
MCWGIKDANARQHFANCEAFRAFGLQHARNRGAFRRLETMYYDTPERLLFQHGISLRVRRNGKHFIQTLKLLPDSGQPLTRRQWEAPVDHAPLICRGFPPTRSAIQWRR